MPFKEYEQNQLLLLPPSLKSFLPSEHPVHAINEVVEGFDLTQLYDKYSPLGSSAYHPQMMLKVLFYAYVMGERSSRQIAHKLKSDLAYLYLSALQQPDFRTINRFRQENLPLIKDLFLQLVRLCTHIGMVSLGKIALDGTRLKANASYQKTKKLPALEEELKLLEKEIDAILRECEEIDSKEDSMLGEANSPYELKEELRDKERLKEKLLQAKEKLTSHNMKEINLTDNDCTTMLHKGYQPEPSYNGQIAVEEKSGLIVSATLTNNASDYEALRILVEEAETNTNLKPDLLLADSGFTSFANLQYLKDKGIVGLLPDQMRESIRKGTCSNPQFHKSKFIYEEASDTYLCPLNQVLNFKRLTKRPGKPAARIYQGRDCPACPKKKECTSNRYRTIQQDPREYLAKEVADRLATKEGQALYGQRKCMVEPVFGDLKHNRNFKSLSLRGRLKALGEFLLLCIAHNLRKIYKYLLQEKPTFKLQLIST